jgi:hypothetical protein
MSSKQLAREMEELYATTLWDRMETELITARDSFLKKLLRDGNVSDPRTVANVYQTAIEIYEKIMTLPNLIVDRARKEESEE